VFDWIARIVINGVALIAAAKLVPNIHLPAGPLDQTWVKIGLIALVFALVNTYIKPIVKTLSFPISIMTLGLFTFVINAGLFLLVAWLCDDLLKITFTVGGFPPKFGIDAVVAAVLGSLVVSIVSTALGFANFGRKAAGLR